MSELKVRPYTMLPSGQCYDRDEVDKVIAELKSDNADLRDDKKLTDAILDERNAEIAELKERLNTIEKLLNKALNGISNGNKHMMSLARKKNHADYKRCLAMANWCFDEGKGTSTVYEVRTFYWSRWGNMWLELAKKFKPNNQTAEEAKENNMEMVETKHDLLTTKYTKVLEEADYKYNAPHTFNVVKAEEETSEEHKGENLVLAEIHFQEGPIKECGVNGVMNEDLIVMAIRRLEGFQNSEFKCRENACAITKLEEALLWLRKRTMGRENRGVEGTNKV